MQHRSIGACLRVALLILAVCLAVAGTTQAQPFTDIGAALVGVEQGSVAWGDYDNDGDLDVLVTGVTNSGLVSKIYRNDGGGTFTDIGAALTPVDDSSVAWGDYDRDGDLDILLTGWAVGGRVAKIYRNDGGGVFTDTGAGLTGVQFGAVAWGDYDNDGDLDVLITGDAGFPGSSIYYGITKIYRNDDGSFTDVNAALPGVYQGAVAWGDYDNDGDLDIVLAGTGNLDDVAAVYRNDGGGVFTAVASLRAGSAATVAWGDYDNDGDLDIFLSDWSGQLYSKVYRNDGGGVFTEVAPALAPVRLAAWGDYDDDGDLDLVGDRLVRNDSGDVFTDLGADWLTGVFPDTTALGDYDNDGDLDLLVAGQAGSSQQATKIYRNDFANPDTAPAAPSGLTSSVGGHRVALSWATANDAQTPAAGLSYNLRVGTSPGAGNVVPPMAAANGWRRIPALGNAQQRRTATLASLAPGTYYWSVQAIDTSLVGSPFAAEGSFTVTSSGCTYSITPRSASVPAAGAGGSVNVTVGAGCAWTAVSNDAWITFTTATSGSGNGTVGYSVAANPVAVGRTGSFMIAGSTFTVTQGPGCEYSLDPPSAIAGAAGGPGSVSVTAQSWCNWTAASNAGTWLTVTAGSPGSGNGTVAYAVAATAGGVRSGALTIGTATFTLNQIALTAHELTHGSSESHTLAADPGPVPHVGRFLVAQAPYSSYEVVVEGTSGDVQPILLERVSGDEATQLQVSEPLGGGAARSLRWSNATAAPVLDELIRVTSGGCTTDCGSDDVYRIRLYDTTGTIPRFNNTTPQTTVLILQNPGDRTVNASAYFWTGSGAFLANVGITIPAQGSFSVNTVSFPPLGGSSGSITVAHDGGYGGLVGKAVGLDPASGFSFDSPLTWKPVR